MKNINQIICIVIVILLQSSLYLCANSHTFTKAERNPFRENKEIIENNINSMLLGNYLRKLMIKVTLIELNIILRTIISTTE